MASCFRTASRIAFSTNGKSFRLRASASPLGRNRLPTWSAWKGGVIPLWYLARGPQIGNAGLRRLQRAVGPVVARRPALLVHAGGEQLAFARLGDRGGFPAEVRRLDQALLLQGEVLSKPVAQRGVPRRVADVDALVGVPQGKYALCVRGFPYTLGAKLPPQAGDRHSPKVAVIVPASSRPGNRPGCAAPRRGAPARRSPLSSARRCAAR